MSGPRLRAAARRGCGVLVLAVGCLPLYRLLDRPETGGAGAYTLRLGDAYAAFAWTGLLVLFLVAVLAARFVRPDHVDRAGRRIGSGLIAVPAARLVAVVAALAALLTVAFTLLVLHGRPGHLDAFVQLLHARFLASGRLGGLSDIDFGFWHVQNAVITERGWVSQYPPGHALLLAAGLRAGAPWVVGPLLVAVTVGFASLTAFRVFGPRSIAARSGSVLLACSTFLIGLGGSFMNHVSAAAFLAVGVWCTVRARDAAGWALAAGLAVGVAIAVRPLTAVAVGTAVALAAWLRLPGPRPALAFAQRAGLAVAGAAPIVLALGIYNRHFFGSPARFGYDVALGPATRPGFGVDPWGNTYGLREAIAYTSADLQTLGVALLETPASVILPVGGLLLLAARLSYAERVFAAWALAPVIANAFYWHHGQYMGPRMLYEAAPAWVFLAASAMLRLLRAAPDELRPGSRWSPRAGLATAVSMALVLAFAIQAPGRIRDYRPDADARAAAMAPPVAGPALVFVPDAWTARLAMQMAASGVRLDSVETAIRQNPTCRVQQFVDALAGSGDVRRAAADRLDFDRRATGLPPLVRIAAGSSIRIAPDEPLTPACAQQVAADRNGVLDIAPLLWQGDLPDGAARGALFVRDLGPQRNAALIAALPSRTPLMLNATADGVDPRVMPYEPAVRKRWSMPETTAARPGSGSDLPAEAAGAADRGTPDRAPVPNRSIGA